MRKRAEGLLMWTVSRRQEHVDRSYLLTVDTVSHTVIWLSNVKGRKRGHSLFGGTWINNLIFHKDE